MTTASTQARGVLPQGHISGPGRSFGQHGRPRRRPVKAAPLSPEARKAAEDADRKMIDDFCLTGKVQKFPSRWANGAVTTSMFGSVEG